MIFGGSSGPRVRKNLMSKAVGFPFELESFMSYFVRILYSNLLV